MSSRFFQKYFIRCGNCQTIQRYAKGYKPIPNPILFDSDAHCRSYHRERRDCTGLTGTLVTCRCDKCARVHSHWTVMDFQEFLDAKLVMTPEERTALLWPGAGSRAEPSSGTSN
ncbi:uncharacterized protein TEOVI_000112000 [Trypanosoma equiperdum]|uniref:Uncharacterized protein n=2 Tax=Trypanozoon TaxID=39700 RepID=Q388L8_TRYB2|nr:hypothetical protein, conserved [Trypanosoma brucei brucei TREU927]EAN78752.1 hypothetical protein, conserved [Trypanosoma brucei brucei TREU927]6HIV_Be Chain Be, mL97 [Trypanosoma brucei brucei]6HIX_Be Chain Be, ml97 [Trypanosoma brucei brucei]SCU69554.1 hypothetical protein, conserved [Trypanosoma equiperdum]